MDTSQGSYFSGYQALGGKSMVGDPLSHVTGSGRGGNERPFDGAVLADQPASVPAVEELPIVTMLAEGARAIYRRVGLPQSRSAVTPLNGAHGCPIRPSDVPILTVA